MNIETTGRHLVLFEEAAAKAAPGAVRGKAGAA